MGDRINSRGGALNGPPWRRPDAPHPTLPAPNAYDTLSGNGLDQRGNPRRHVSPERRRLLEGPPKWNADEARVRAPAVDGEPWNQSRPVPHDPRRQSSGEGPGQRREHMGSGQMLRAGGSDQAFRSATAHEPHGFGRDRQQQLEERAKSSCIDGHTRSRALEAPELRPPGGDDSRQSPQELLPQSGHDVRDFERRRRDPRLAPKIDAPPRNHDPLPERFDRRPPPRHEASAIPKPAIGRPRPQAHRPALAVQLPPADDVAAGPGPISAPPVLPRSAPSDPRRRRGLRPSPRAISSNPMPGRSPPRSTTGGENAGTAVCARVGEELLPNHAQVKAEPVLSTTNRGLFGPAGPIERRLGTAAGNSVTMGPQVENDGRFDREAVRIRHDSAAPATGRGDNSCIRGSEEATVARERSRSHSSDCPVRGDGLQRPFRPSMTDAEGGRRGWNERDVGLQGSLAVSIKGVTLGGSGLPRPFDGAEPVGQVQLPLRRPHPAPAGDGMPLREASPSGFGRTRGQPQPRREPPLFRGGPPRSQDDVARPRGPPVPRNPAPPPPEQSWSHGPVPSDSVRRTDDYRGVDDECECDRPLIRNRSGIRMTPPLPEPDFGFPYNGGHRRSAYAQAMRNKRFMGSASTGAGHERPDAGPIARTPDAGWPGSMTTPFGPRGPPAQPDTFPPQERFPPREHVPHGHFPSPRPQRWQDSWAHGPGGSRDRGFEAGKPLGGDGFGVLNHEEQYTGHTSVFFGGESEDEYEDLPLLHTSPEWTPAVAAAATDPEKKSDSNDAGWASESPSTGSVDKEDASPKEDDGTHEQRSERSAGGSGRETTPGTKEKRGDPPTDEGKSVNGGTGSFKSDPPRTEARNENSPHGRQPAALACKSEPAGSGSIEPESNEVPLNDAERSARGRARSARSERLEPSPLSRVVWSAGDLAKRFPKLSVPEALTHVIASWVILDTRAIGVVPMLCQPIAEVDASINKRAGAAREKRETPLEGSSEAPIKGKRKRVDDDRSEANERVCGTAALDRAWEARVLVPHGVVFKRAASGCWAEALQLALVSSSARPSRAGGGGNEADDDDTSNVDQPLATLPGGTWVPDLDGSDPSEADNRALIRTAIRTGSAATGVDLSRCTRWLKFCEVHHDDTTTVVFLCGGHVRVAKRDAGSVCVVTIADVIAGRVSPSGREVWNSSNGLSASFEAQLTACFLWGLVSRDWAGVVLDTLRQQAEPSAKTASAPEAPALSVEKDAKTTPAGTAVAAPSELAGNQAEVEDRKQERPPLSGGAAVGPATSTALAVPMAETPAEVRAAFGLFDTGKTGCVSSDRLQAWLTEAGLRLSAKYIKTLLRRVCRTAGDGSASVFEYRKSFQARRLQGDGQTPVEGAGVPSGTGKAEVSRQGTDRSLATIDLRQLAADLSRRAPRRQQQ